MNKQYYSFKAVMVVFVSVLMLLLINISIVIRAEIKGQEFDRRIDQMMLEINEMLESGR